MDDDIPTTEPGEPTQPAPALLASSPPPAAPHPGRVFVPKWLVIAIAALVIVGLGFGIGWAVTSDDSTESSTAPSGATTPTTPNRPTTPTTTPTTTPGTTSPPSATVPSSSALSKVGLRQTDLASSISLTLIPGGNSVSGGPTLDLCNGTYASESERRTRLQLAAVDAEDNTTLSTEAVQYVDAAATQQAFAELREIAAKCPSTPVPSPVGETTVTTKFNPAPDGSWPQVAGVDRQGYDFVTSSALGQTQH